MVIQTASSINKQKRKFTSLHKRYNKNQELCHELNDEYIDLLNNPLIDDRDILTILSRKYNIPRTTLVGWAKKWKSDPNWLPGDFLKYSLVKRIFDDEKKC